MKIIGNFNLKDIKWNTSLDTTGELEKQFINCFQDNFLEQLNDSPTIHREG